MILARTPFRVSFLGGGTDYPAWYREHGGAVLSTTIAHYCNLMVRRLPPFFEYRHRVAWSELEHVSNLSDIRHPAARAVLERFGLREGLSVTHDGDLPARSGLGSSSAFTVGLLHAMHALEGRMPTKEGLAQEAIQIEQEALREAVGLQDQVACAYGGLNAVRIAQDGSWRVDPLVLPAERLRELESSLLLYFTGVQRYASTIAAQQVERVKDNAAALRDLAAMVDEGVSVLAGPGPLQEFGRLLDEAWILKRSLSEAVSSQQIDELYSHARKWGAVGGKLLGAGGGGFMLFFCPLERQGALRAALQHWLEVPFRFERWGSRIVYAEGR